VEHLRVTHIAPQEERIAKTSCFSSDSCECLVWCVFL